MVLAMRVTRPPWIALGAFLGAAVIVHGALLWGAPRWATDHQIREGLRRGGSWNTLLHGQPPTAGSTSVPLANADTLGSRAYLDLRGGPLILEGVRPESCTYWSATVFAHDTDTVTMLTDGDTPDRQVSLGIRLAGQRLAEAVATEAVLPSARGVLLVRCFMRDRADQEYLQQLDRERRQLQLRRVGGAPP
jgi:uncharacterized membrane protein